MLYWNNYLVEIFWIQCQSHRWCFLSWQSLFMRHIQFSPSEQQQQQTTSNTQKKGKKNIDERIMNTPRKVEPKNNNKNINIISMLCVFVMFAVKFSFQHDIINTSHECDRWWIIQLSIENGVELFPNRILTPVFKGPFYVCWFVITYL